MSGAWKYSSLLESNKNRPNKLLWAGCGLASGLVLLLITLQHRKGPYPSQSLTAPIPANEPLLPYAISTDLRTAVARAEQVWRKNVEKREQFVYEHKGAASMHMYSGFGRTQMYTAWDVFVPSWPCPFEVERIGRMGDGGKFVCGLPHVSDKRGRDLVLMSFGVERESSFELEVLERSQGQAYLYDFSVKEYGPQLKQATAEIQSRAHFRSYGLGMVDEEVGGNQFYTLQSLMQQNGIDHIDILKIDVEGAEAKVLPRFFQDWGDRDLPFDQLLLEIHGNADFGGGAYDFAAFANWWEKLEAAGLRASFNELNYPAVHWNGGTPWAIEYTFINACRDGSGRCSRLLTA